MTEPSKRIFVKMQRKDGKLHVVYVFPLSGVKLTKIITVDKLAEERARGYEVLGWRFSNDTN